MMDVDFGSVYDLAIPVPKPEEKRRRNVTFKQLMLKAVIFNLFQIMAH